MNVPGNVRLDQTLATAGPLVEAAERAARATRKKPKEARRRPRGATLRPGNETPMWNEFVAVVRPMIAQRGEKAKLARIVSVPRQRIHDWFVSRKAWPDPERMLLLLAWLADKRAGKNPS